jgi:TonB-linked SusC/RagA family outer membrane protein
MENLKNQAGFNRLLKKLLLKMKLTLTIFLFCLAGAAASTYSQNTRLDIKLENGNMVELIKQIEAKSEFMFYYQKDELSELDDLTVEANNATVMEILDQVTKGTGFDYTVIERYIVVRKVGDDFGNDFLATARENIAAQQRAVSGRVTDSGNQPLPGVTVVIKGTTQGTVTNADGDYTLTNVPDDATLVFSFVGMRTQEVVVGNQTNINVSMEEETIGIEEVVAIGYGVQRKETLSGSVSAIQSEEIISTKSENLINNIQGKVPGLQIRQRTGEPGVFDNLVSIRGYGNPLIVIDGVTRDGVSEFAQLNPDDVESISILKDASAAIYGMNAANGVIIVTTKKGKRGEMSVSYSGLYGIKGATGLEQTVDAYTYRLMRNEMDKNIRNAPYYSEEILEKYRLGEPGYTDTDWIDLCLYDWVSQQQHTVSVRGGSEKVRYFSSLGYTEDNGLLKSDIQKYRRYNFRSTTTADLSDNLELNVSVSGRFSEQQQPRNDFLWVFKPIMVNDRGQNYHTIANEEHMTALPPENTNPYAMMHEEWDGYRRNNVFQYQSTLEIIYKTPFIEGLKATGLAAYDGNIDNSARLQKAYGLYDYYTDQRQTTYGSDRYQSTMFLYNRLHLRGQLDYNLSVNEHNFNFLAVTELTRTRSDRLQGERYYSDLYTHDIIDQGSSTTATNSGYRRFGILAAYLARVNYDYKSKYLLEAVARYDGSYRYAPAQRWAFFPSISLGWRISEESFISENLPFIDNLKLRVSYGESGRDVGNAFEYIAGYSGSSASAYAFNPGELTVGMTAPGVVNENLTWITSETSNIGIDFDFWNGKFGGAIDVFQRKNTGLLATRIQSVPNTFGASFPQENIDSDLNHGIEIMFSHRGKIGSDISYKVSANTTYSRLKRLHVERAEFNSSWDRWRNGNENRYTGRMLNHEYDGRYTSLEQYETAPLMGGTQGNSRMLPGSFAIIDMDGNGIINNDDRTYNHWSFGNINPPLQYGLTLAGTYKTFDLNVLLQGAALYTINFRNNDIWGYGRYPSLHERFLDRWHTKNPEGDPYDPTTEWIEGYYPALRTNTSNTTDGMRVDVWTPPATYLRLKSVEVGYNLPQGFARKIGMKNARLFLNGFNLYTFTRKELKQIDPEKQEYDWDANLTYPLMKSFNLGLNLNF